MEQTRLVLIVALSFLALLLWQAWQQDYNTASRQLISNDSPIASAPIPATPISPPITADLPVANAQSTVPAIINVITDTLALKINRIGGVIETASLLHYPATNDSSAEPFRLFDNSPTRFFIEQGGLKSDQQSPDHYGNFSSDKTEYKLDPNQNELTVTLTWASGTGVVVSKQLLFKRASYAIDVTYTIKNGGSSPWSFHHYEQLQRTHFDKTQYFIHTFTGAAISSPAERYTKYKFENLAKDPINQEIANGWAAILEHYFVSAVIPAAEKTYHYYSSSIGTNNYVVGFYGPLQKVDGGETTTATSRLYIGPKLQNSLPGVAPRLELTIDYGLLWFIAKLLFLILSYLHRLFSNWGWAIIVLTFILKLVFFPLSAAGYRSMAKMRRVQPRLVAIRERYVNDKTRLNQAMMDLYKEEKINPLGGCFPILVQIPVFISLYWVILESVELRQAPWIFWIKDLSTMDPRFVLPVLMTISMWLQSKLNPAPLDPIQARVMQIMPFAFGTFFAFFPSGLVLYWFVNNVLSIAQQWHITRATQKT